MGVKCGRICDSLRKQVFPPGTASRRNYERWRSRL